MIRSFLAVELTSYLRRELARLQDKLKQRWSNDLGRDMRVSWVRAESIHLTLKFLGDMDEQLVPRIQQAVEEVGHAHRPVSVPLVRLGVFPRAQQPRVLWVGASEEWEQSQEAGRLHALHQDIEACCRVLDFTPENRPLNPHVTLARIKEGERRMSQIIATSGVMDKSVPLPPLIIESIVLMKSVLQPTGSIYTKLWDVRLNG